MAITLESHGKFKRTKNFLKRILELDLKDLLNQYGQMGVENLSALTPVDTGKTAASWYYTVFVSSDGSSANLSWWNSNVNEGVPIALVIEYGHITGWGGYVPPYPYIDEALAPVIQRLQEELWEDIVG